MFEHSRGEVKPKKRGFPHAQRGWNDLVSILRGSAFRSGGGGEENKYFSKLHLRSGLPAASRSSELILQLWWL